MDSRTVSDDQRAPSIKQQKPMAPLDVMDLFGPPTNSEAQRSQRYVASHKLQPPQLPNAPPPSQQPLSDLERKFLKQQQQQKQLQQQQQQQQQQQNMEQSNAMSPGNFTSGPNNSRIPIPVSPRNFATTSVLMFFISLKLRKLKMLKFFIISVLENN